MDVGWMEKAEIKPSMSWDWRKKITKKGNNKKREKGGKIKN